MAEKLEPGVTQDPNALAAEQVNKANGNRMNSEPFGTEVLTDSNLAAGTPESQDFGVNPMIGQRTMSEIQVIQFDPVTGLATMGMGSVPKILTGMDKLKQIVILSYLRNPGQDVFYPQEGSGLRATIGQYNFTDSDELKTLFVQRTKAVEKEIISRQSSNKGTPEERLNKLVVIDVAYDFQTAVLIGRVQIINEAGGVSDVLV